MNFKSFTLFRKTLFVPVIQLRYNKYIQNRTLRKMENIMVNQSKYVSSDFPEATYQVAFEDLKKKILVGHQEIIQGKVSSLADARKEFGLD